MNGVGLDRHNVPRFNGNVTFRPDKLFEPLRKKDAVDWFVNSMSDLFHPGFKFHEVAAIVGVMIAAARDGHIFKVLTKRPGTAVKFFDGLKRASSQTGKRHALICIEAAEFYIEQAKLPDRTAKKIRERLASAKVDADDAPFDGIAFGTSVENKAALRRLDLLLQVPNALPWVSVEPLLESVSLSPWLKETTAEEAGVSPALKWVVAGGESGPNARICRVEWLKAIRQECFYAGVPFFLKQLGAKPVTDSGGSLDFALAWKSRGLTGVHYTGDGRGSFHLQLQDEKGGDPSEWTDELNAREYPEGWSL